MAFLALKAFTLDTHPRSILLRIDNVTAMAYVNKMGGTHSSSLSNLAVEVWKWCIATSIRIHAEHLPGKEHVQADWQSRHCRDSSDWKLDEEVFAKLDEVMGPFSIDLFASRTNKQLPVYCSWKPDPSACAVDALSFPWTNHYPYLFPPFTMINRCLEKIMREEVDAVMIAPIWQNQVWYPGLLKVLISEPILLPMSQDIIQNTQGESHPLVIEGHLPLAAWPISDRASAQCFSEGVIGILKKSWRETTESALAQFGGNGIAGVLQGVYIQFQHL